jgi:WhiB family redox-sensing transcriptional regulator
MSEFSNYANELLKQPQATPTSNELRGTIPVSTSVEAVPDPRRIGACFGLEVNTFYPDSKDEKGRKAAIAICYGACAVRLECLEYALVNKEEYGILGGATQSERKRMQRARKKVS